MNREDLLIYEMPSYVDYISNNWLQHKIAERLVKKVDKKIKRYKKRLFLKELYEKNEESGVDRVIKETK